MSAVLTDREETKQAIARFKLFGLFPVLLFGLLLHAYFLLLLWHWFVMPLGVRDINYWHAAGLSAMFSYLRGSQLQNKENRDYYDWVKIIKTSFREMVFFFVIAWLFHLFMGH